MANERKTENIVREILRSNGYFDDDTITIEEQSSNISSISTLLKNASKSGKKGKGFPEFIISFKNRPEDIIVIECKASISNHQSNNIENYESSATKFAVDGVLWYASYLKNE